MENPTCKQTLPSTHAPLSVQGDPRPPLFPRPKRKSLTPLERRAMYYRIMEKAPQRIKNEMSKTRHTYKQTLPSTNAQLSIQGKTPPPPSTSVSISLLSRDGLPSRLSSRRVFASGQGVAGFLSCGRVVGCGCVLVGLFCGLRVEMALGRHARGWGDAAWSSVARRPVFLAILDAICWHHLLRDCSTFPISH